MKRPFPFANTDSRFSPLLILGFLLFLNSLSATYYQSAKAPKIDFFTWWAVPHGIAQGYIQVPYSHEDRRKLAEEIHNEIKTTQKPNVEENTFEDVLKLYEGSIIATAPPFFYTVFNRLVSDDYQKDKKKFVILSLISFTLAFCLVARLLNHSYLNIFIFYALVTTSFSPYISEVRVGNVNQIQLLFISLFIFLWTKAKGFYHYLGAGFILGCLTFFKPNMSFIIFFAFLASLLNKSKEKVLGLTGGIVLSALIVYLETGAYFKSLRRPAWESWLKICSETMSGYFGIELGNFSFPKLLISHHAPDISILIYMAMVGLFIWIYWMSSRASNTLQVSRESREEKAIKEAFLITGFGILTLLLGSKLVWLHYYLAIIPLFLFLLRPQVERNYSSRPQSLIVPLTLLAVGLSTQMISRILNSHYLGAVNLILIALILLYVLTLEMLPQTNVKKK